MLIVSIVGKDSQTHQEGPVGKLFILGLFCGLPPSFVAHTNEHVFLPEPTWLGFIFLLNELKCIFVFLNF